MSAMRALAMVALTLAAAPAATGVHHTASGMAAARAALLRTSDLGRAWKAGATPKKPGDLTCGGTPASVAGVVETGRAASPTFRASDAGPFVAQTSYVYASAAAALAFWKHAVGPQTKQCAVDSLTAGSTKAVTFTASRVSVLAAPPVGRHSAAFRVQGQAKTAAQRVRVYLDVVLLIRGNTITELGFSSFAQPFAHADELRIDRRAAARL
jgi:hypothetical protein